MARDCAEFWNSHTISFRKDKISAHNPTAATTAEHQTRVLPQLLSLEQRLSDMDLMGIDVQAVSPSPDQTYYGLPPDLAIQATRMVNDYINGPYRTV